MSSLTSSNTSHESSESDSEQSYSNDNSNINPSIMIASTQVFTESKFIEQHRGNICLDVMTDVEFDFLFPSASNGSSLDLDSEFLLLLEDISCNAEENSVDAEELPERKKARTVSQFPQEIML